MVLELMIFKSLKVLKITILGKWLEFGLLALNSSNEFETYYRTQLLNSSNEFETLQDTATKESQ